MIIMMVITTVFVLKMAKFWKLERKKLSLFQRAFPTKNIVYFRARASRARANKGKGVQQRFPLYHHPNFYDFFPRAIAPFTGTESHERD